MKTLAELFEACAALHPRLCPRQVLGVRMGSLAGGLLGIDLPQPKKRLLAIVETDGCFADGVAVATHCWVGRRTLRVEDYGKAAATFVDTVTGRAVRLAPRPGIRGLAREYAPQARSRWAAQLAGYQVMPDEILFKAQPVALKTPIPAITGRPGLRVSCDRCGEEIINGREVRRQLRGAERDGTRGQGVSLCLACAGDAYYRLLPGGADDLPLPGDQPARLSHLDCV